MNFKSIFENSSDDKLVSKAFSKLEKSYGWGDYRFDMGDFELSTYGGNDNHYDAEDDSAIMTVQADNVDIFTFTWSDSGYKVDNINDKKLFKVINNKIINNEFSEAKD